MQKTNGTQLRGGGVLARSSSGQVTGFGAGVVEKEGDEVGLFGGAIVIDDPIKPDDAASDTIRGKINNKFNTTIRNRVNSRKTPIIVIMQRLHEQDLCGYLQEIESEAWRVIKMPVIQKDGTALWEHKHTIEELRDLRKIDEFTFDTQYMQDPTPKEGLMFPKEELNRFKLSDFDPELVDAKVGFVDIADEGEDSHSLPIGQLIGNKLYITDILFTKENAEANVDSTADLINKITPEYVRVESNFGGTMYISLLQPKINGVTALLPIRAKGNKFARIKTISGFIKEYLVFLDESEYDPNSDYAKFMYELTHFLKNGKSKHDDAPDSLEGLCALVRQFYPNLWG